MRTIEIRGVPDEVVAILSRRAELAGTSLSIYLRDHFVAFAAEPEVTDRHDSDPD